MIQPSFSFSLPWQMEMVQIVASVMQDEGVEQSSQTSHHEYHSTDNQQE